ncbi:MAG: patatin-like phospholipase family protein, partial [Desulfobacteraceae bacterium]|jgi:NTE family protein|nr:patatin-like phospholipase family protein [Desulfobacteraceae bacterium]
MKRALILSGGGARGAFQVGVWKYLREIKWIPDLICGTSIGAINAAAIGSGMSVERLADLWRTRNRAEIYRFKAGRFLRSALGRKPLKSLLDGAPLRAMLTRNLDIEALRQSPMEVIISAVHLATGRLHLYNQAVIEIDHLMASSAMPILFPWQPIRGELHWDGGVMANSPLFIALERKVEEIIVVLLSPVGHRPLPPPATLREGLELVFEHFLIGSYQTAMPVFNGQDGAPRNQRPRIFVVAPSQMLGFASLLNFSTRQVNRLINAGYHNARRQLSQKGRVITR